MTTSMRRNTYTSKDGETRRGGDMVCDACEGEAFRIFAIHGHAHVHVLCLNCNKIPVCARFDGKTCEAPGPYVPPVFDFSDG